MKQPSIRPVSSTEESARHGSGARAVITPNVKLPIEDGRDVYERSNLTRHQLLIWLGQKFEPDVPLYNVAVTFTLSGGLDPGHFRKAFQTLIDSSDALRTVIEEMDGVPQQRVLESLRYEAAYLDFSASSEPEAAFQNWLQDRARVLFDFRRRLFDSALAKIGADRFVWFLNQHHIITDGWSVALAYQYMSELYERSLHGRLDEAAPLPRFEDYIRREREDRTSARHSEAAAYWKRKLADKPEPLVYSGSYQKRTHNVQRVSCNLGVERTQRIKALAARKDVFSATEQASIFNIFAALLFIYLYRVTGNRRQSIGAPFLNRRSNAFRETLGLFMEVLPLHVALEEGDTPLSVIRKVRGEMSEIGRFSGFTLANSPGDKSYDVLLNYHIAPFAKFHGLSMEQKWIYTGRENDALALQVYEVEDAGTFALHFDFHSDVFNAEQRRQAVRHFLQLFDAFAEDPAGSLYSVSLLDPEERQRLLVEWNSTKRDYPRDKCVHELFEAQVERTPDAVALVFPSTGSGHGEDGQITYRELNRRANQLAHYLKRRGLGPEVLAGIYMERSLEMALALLGILKAGAAYVPIDASYPQPRVEFMLRDSAMAVLLTQRRLAERLPQDGVHTICLDADCPDIARESDANPVSGARPQNLAYVIYTSGSTGTPKGVLIEHRQILNYVQAIWERYGLKTGATFAMLQPLSVDSSQTVIFPALISGGCLHIISEERAADPQALSEYFFRFPIDLLKIAPSHLAALQSSSRPEQLLPRRWLIVGGEVSHWDWMNRIHALASCAIFNHYGPTEATVGMSTYRVEKDQNAHGSSTVPIGRPLPNTQAFLLDRRLQPVPIGVAGELHIGGSCLARGYLNHPELTAEKFISHPFSDEAGARLYKTGDLARYLPDGNIEFLGRLDNQIKIRGFRVEPGEIEAALVQHPAVREAVIVARENPSASLRTGTQLIAYVVPKQKASSHAPELRAFLRQKLPDPLVPAFFIPLDALPRTPHGKLDRHALPTPDQARAELDETPAEPRNPIENALARIWSQLLGLKRVGVHDSFFDLGGHSLLAVEMMQRVEQVCGEKLPLSMLLEGPTIKQLAAALFKQRVEENRSLLVKVQSGGSKQPFFYLHGDWQGGGFYCLELARSLGADQPFYALTPHGVQGAAAPTTVEAMAASYIQMVRAVQPEGPYFLGGICNGAVVAFEMARQLEQQGCRVNLVLLIGAHARTVLPRRLLHGVISRLGSWLGLSPEARSRLFLGIRDFGHRVRRLFRNSRHPLNAQFRPRLSERDQEIHEVLAGALGAYVPQPYGGRVAVLWPTDERFNRERDPTLGWGRVTSQLDMELIPGGHITCVTRHLDKLAARMKAHLERAQGNGASDTAARFR